MTVRSFLGVAALSATAAFAAFAASPAIAQQLQAVPRAGVSFPNTVTVRAKLESVDPDTRTVVFTTTDGRAVSAAAAPGINLASLTDGSTADVTYNEVVTVLNLRQKGPGSQEARKEASTTPASEIDSGRFTMTVVGVDIAANKVSLIDGRGGEVRTLAATSIARQDMLKKIKPGDVVIGLTTPLTITAITPAK